MTQQRTLKVERLGLVEYGAALEIQKQTERAVLTGSQPDTLLLLEHPHTLTLGRRSAQNGIMAPEEILKARGVSVFETNRGGKVAAIGVHIARWVTTHGFALNVNTDLSYFNLIIACEGEPVTSMKELLGREVEMSEVEDRIIERFAEVFEMEIDGHRGTETQRIKQKEPTTVSV